MNKALIVFFAFLAITFVSCKDEPKVCLENQVWNETTKKCEAKPVEAALLTQEQCKNDLTKIWDTQNNKCKNRLQGECNADGTKWENDQCVKIQASAGKGAETPGSTESEELYTITNNSSFVVIAVSALADPSILPEYNKRFPPDRLAYIGLKNGECVNVTKDQFTTSLNIKKSISTSVCNNLPESTTKCNDGTPAHLAINDHPTTDGQRYRWVEIVATTAEKHTENCLLLKRRN